MAPIAFILGGISGTFSALIGMVLFGLSLWSAAQVYFAVGLLVATSLILVALLRQRPVVKPANAAKPHGMQQA